MAARHECNLSRLVQAHHALGRLSGRLLRLRRRRLPSLLPPSRLRCLGCLRQARVVRGAACAASTATARGSPGGPGVAGQVRRRGGAAVTFAAPGGAARATRASATIAAEVQRPRVRQRCLRRRARAQRACADLQAARNAYKLTRGGIYRTRTSSRAAPAPRPPRARPRRGGPRPPGRVVGVCFLGGPRHAPPFLF